MSTPPGQSLIPPPPAITKAETVEQFDSAPRASATSRVGHHMFTLPESVMDSVHWRGADADRFFAIDEPTFDQLQTALANTDAANLATKLPDFVRAIGIPGPDGKVARANDGEIVRGEDGAPMTDVDGNPVRLPGTPLLHGISYITATAWLARLGTKGKMMVVAVWTETFAPSNAEGEALRGSKVRLG